MTTVTVVRKNGVAAIAADSMTKWGTGKETADYIVNHHKIIQIGDTYLALTGAPAAKLILKDYFSKAKNKPPKFENVASIFGSWLGLHAAMKETYFLNPSGEDEDAFETTQIDVALANPYGIFGVAQHRDVQEYSRFYALGSGYSYAVGAMFAVYHDPDKTAEEIARIGVQAAADFDDSTGLPVFSFTVPLLTPEEKAETPLPKTSRK